MRNPLARLVRHDPAKPSLRERLTATRAKARQVLAMNRILLKPEAKPAPAVDRAALVNYATWLYTERRLLCAELYPHAGTGSDRFVMEARAADRFHFPPGSSTHNTSSPSKRAVQILDMVGVDWRSDSNGDPDYGIQSLKDDGTRPVLPSGRPTLDDVLLAALADLSRLDDAISGVVLPATYDDPRDVPAYAVLDDAREKAIEILIHERARGMPGLKVKAKALLSPSVSESDQTTQEIAQSLARDLISARQSILAPLADPILVAIAESRRLQRIYEDICRLPQPAGRVAPLPEQDAAFAAFNNHRVDVLLKTVPRTAAGAAALARYALEYEAENGVPFDEDPQGIQSGRILALIARSPLL